MGSLLVGGGGVTAGRRSLWWWEEVRSLLLGGGGVTAGRRSRCWWEEVGSCSMFVSSMWVDIILPEVGMQSMNAGVFKCTIQKKLANIGYVH